MPLPSPPTAADALRWLEAEGLATTLRPGADVLRRAAPDATAVPGDVSWLSARALAADPARAARFSGSLLVVPAAPEHLPGAAVAVAADPRLAFSRLVTHAWPEAASMGWPRGPVAVAPDARIAPDVVLAPGVVVGADVVLEAGVRVGPNTCLAHCTLQAGVVVGPNCSIGTDGFGYTRDAAGELVPFPHVGRVVLEAGVTVGANTCIDRGALGETRIGARSRIDNLVHIAHNVTLGPDSAVIAHAMVAGSVTTGPRAWIAPAAAVRNGLTLGADATVGMAANVVRDVAAGTTVAGNPARPFPPPPHGPD